VSRTSLALLLIVVFGLALGLRLAVLAQGSAGPDPLFGELVLDEAQFARIAADIRCGEGAGDGPYVTSPLYPYLLALFPGIEEGGAQIPVRAAQLILGALTAVLAALTSARRFGAVAGWVAGLALATLGPAMHSEAQVIVAGPLALLMIAALTLEPDVAGPRSTARALGAGVCLGLAAALRATALLPAVALVGVLLVRRRGRAGAWLTTGVLAVVLPFTLRNAVVGGEPVLLTTSGGFNLWVGNHRGAPGIFAPPPGYDFASDPVGRGLAEAEAGRAMGATEASDWWRARALDEVKAAPREALQLWIRKLALVFHPGEIPQLGPDDMRPYRRGIWALRGPLDARWLLLAALLAPLVVGWAGGREGLARGNLARLAAPGAMALAYGLTLLLFFVSGRFRAPLLPLACVLTGATVQAALGLAPRRRWAAAGAFGGLLLASLWVYRDGGPLVLGEAGKVLDRAHQLAGEGDFTGSAEAYRAVLAEDPRHARAAFELAGLIAGPLKGSAPAEKLAAWRAAEPLYARAVAVQPRFAEAWFNLGVARLQLRRFPGATEALNTALGLANGNEDWCAEARRALAIARNAAPGAGG
jgi:tetratricopeptide (TPR) repeat protein